MANHVSTTPLAAASLVANNVSHHCCRDIPWLCPGDARHFETSTESWIEKMSTSGLKSSSGESLADMTHSTKSVETYA